VRRAFQPVLSALAPRSGFPRAGRLAVAVAFQDFLPDGFLHVEGGLVVLLLIAGVTGASQRHDDDGIAPIVELLHECFWFGHIFVPFGKPECFGSGQLALLATGRQEAAGTPGPVTADWLHFSCGELCGDFMVTPSAAEVGRIKKAKSPALNSRGFTGLGCRYNGRPAGKEAGFVFYL
jgi:hypothetical protein